MRKRADIHIVPLRDLRPHDQTRQCLCRPKIEIVGVRGVAVVTHHSYDGREYFEETHDPAEVRVDG